MTTDEMVIRNLRALRVKAGLTQGQLGKKAGIYQPLISQYELGKHKPRGRNLSKIIALLRECFPEGLPVLDRSSGSFRVICPHCGAANHHYIETPIPGLELKCIACSRTWYPFGGTPERPRRSLAEQEGNLRKAPHKGPRSAWHKEIR